MRFHKLPYAVALLILIYPNHFFAQQDQQEPSAASGRRGGPITPESFERISMSAEQGDVFQQLTLGWMYAGGTGVTQDYIQAYIQAYMWLTLASDGFAQAGNDARLNTTQWMLDSFTKQMTPKQIEEAKRLAREWESTHVQNINQAKENMPEPPANTGTRGIPSSQEQIRAAAERSPERIRVAAEQGDAISKFVLAAAYFEGRGVKQNYKEAANWYRKAACQGFANAQFNLGGMYFDGKGVKRDYVQAHVWLSIFAWMAVEATEELKEKAATIRDEIAKKMTPKQKEEAQQLCKQWVSMHLQGPTGTVGTETTPLALVRPPTASDASVQPVTAPLALVQPLPPYTDKAREARVSGMVMLQCIIRNDGTVGSCKIVKGLGYGLDESAINTITTKWRFKPGTLAGKPVDVMANVEVSFRVY
jgi:uncharacterized protein